jgi:pyruvate formate lyase activating enzyme
MQTTSSSLDLSTRGLVADIDHFAVHDGPGIRTAVFLKGCPLHCQWCHSPETMSLAPELLYLPQKCTACGLCLSACPQEALAPDIQAVPDILAAPDILTAPEIPAAPEQAQPDQPCRVVVDWARCTHCAACTLVCYPGALKMSGAWQSAADVLAQVAKDQPFFAASGGGVTLTGGEATAQPRFARQFLAGCRALGIHTALETNGCAPWTVFEELLPLVNLFLFDLKHMDDAAHRRLTGASNHLALSNLRRLAECKASVIARVPCIPGLNDSPENIAATASFARQAGLPTIHLLPYNTSAPAKYQWLGQAYGLDNLSTQSDETMQALADICREYGLDVQVER